jgi:hypothetical protein
MLLKMNSIFWTLCLSLSTLCKLVSETPRACIIKLFTGVINCLTQKASVFVKTRTVTGNSKGTSFLHFEIYYGCKKFYDTGTQGPML